jgi:hypothetical protein
MMNALTRTLSLVIVGGVLLVFSSCGGDDPAKSAEEVQLGKLSKTWNIVSATLDGTPRTADFTSFQLTISGTFNSGSPSGPYNYSVSGSRPTPSPWPNSGTWSFSGSPSGDTGVMTRQPDNLPMSYSISSSGQLVVTFTCSTCDFAGARTKAVNGNWVFTMN